MDHSPFTTSIWHYCGSFIDAVRQEKEIKDIQVTKEEIKMSSANHRNIYVENLKYFEKNIPETNKKL